LEKLEITFCTVNGDGFSGNQNGIFQKRNKEFE